MLVLTRKLQEQIAIGQEITITVLRVKGNTVRIGIEAPSHIRVVRGELPRHAEKQTPSHPSQKADDANVVPTSTDLAGFMRKTSSGNPCDAAQGTSPEEHSSKRRCSEAPTLSHDSISIEPVLAVH